VGAALDPSLDVGLWLGPMLGERLGMSLGTLLLSSGLSDVEKFVLGASDGWVDGMTASNNAVLQTMSCDDSSVCCEEKTSSNSHDSVAFCIASSNVAGSTSITVPFSATNIDSRITSTHKSLSPMNDNSGQSASRKMTNQ
jgi:hypothetical protein